jgi:hypothetical protein
MIRLAYHYAPMSVLSRLLEQQIEFAAGAVPSDELQFWREWFARGCAMRAQLGAEPVAVNFAQATPESEPPAAS